MGLDLGGVFIFLALARYARFFVYLIVNVFLYEPVIPKENWDLS